MKKRIWSVALVLAATAAALAHAALPPSVLPSPLYLSTVSPHVVLSNTEDPTEISMQVPDTIGAVGTQRLSKDITYTNTCTLNKAGMPTPGRTTVTYPRVSASVTRVSTNEVLVEWKTRHLDKMSTYTMDTCTIEAPLWVVKDHSQTVALDGTTKTTDGWTLKLTTELPGFGAQH